jgi:acyl carrier protein
MRRRRADRQNAADRQYAVEIDCPRGGLRGVEPRLRNNVFFKNYIAVPDCVHYNGLGMKLVIGCLHENVEVSAMTFEKIKEIIIEQLQADGAVITMETHLMKDLEADSLDAVEIIMAIEDEFDIEVPDEDAENFQSVGDIVRYVDEQIRK